jgi:hypothetical protein
LSTTEARRGGCGEIADAGDFEQALDDRVVLVKPLEFSIEVSAALL